MCGASSPRRGQNVRVPDQPPAFQFYAKALARIDPQCACMNLAERGAYHRSFWRTQWNDG